MLAKSKAEELFPFYDQWKAGSRQRISSQLPKKIDLSNLLSMGSCDARDLIRCFEHLHLTDRKMPWGVLHNPFSIEIELRRAFSPIRWKEYLFNFWDSNESCMMFRDGWRSWHKSRSLTDLGIFNDSLDKKAKKCILESSGFFFTLGLSEVWFLKKNSRCILDRVPIEAIHMGESKWNSRFASFEETIKTLNAIIELLHSVVGNDKPIFFSLSPVPLKFTSSSFSIREANNLSKAILLSAIHIVCSGSSHVYYFPYYEIVQSYAERGISVFQEDQRHLTAFMVREIAKEFIHGYSNIEKKRLPSLNVGDDFWVPRVMANGSQSGKLFVDGRCE